MGLCVSALSGLILPYRISPVFNTKMARPLRIEFPGAFYHITSRGDRREPIFEDDTDRRTFLDICGAALKRYDASLLAYCLMGNHYHLVVQTHKANLSELLRQVNGVYTQNYNRRHGMVGHLFQGRFKAILVDSDAYLLLVCRYVELNPLRAKIARHLDDWKWSSYRAHTGKECPPPWLDTSTVHGYLLGHTAIDANDVIVAAARYARLVEQGQDVNLWKTSLRQQIYLGDDAFITRMQALLDPKRKSASEVPVIQRQPIAKSVTEYLQDRDRNEAITLAYEEGRHTLFAIAHEVGLSVARVSKVIAAQKEKNKT